MKCVRCLQESASKVASAPDGSGAWEVYCCDRCNFSWRSTEEPHVINPELRDPWFQLEEDPDDLPSPLIIPPLLQGR